MGWLEAIIIDFHITMVLLEGIDFYLYSRQEAWLCHLLVLGVVRGSVRERVRASRPLLQIENQGTLFM